MLNVEDFIKRLEFLMDQYALNASSFADKIGVQRSSISHLLSGRNKPSLEFILKIVEVFPDTNLYWLLNGKNDFNTKTDPLMKKEVTTTPLYIDENKLKMEINEIQNPAQKTGNKIQKIVLFYENGTFTEFNPA